MALAKATPFMKTLGNRMVRELGVADTTAVQYLQTLFRMNDNKPFRNMGWSKDHASVEKSLADLADSTKAIYYRVLASVLSLYKTYGKQEKYWKTLADKVQPVASEKKSEKQEENWLEWSDVEKVRDALEKKTSLLRNLRTSKTLSDGSFTNLLEYLILSLYTLIPPRRNKDYSLMRVVKKWRPSMTEEFNYYDESDQKFIFNQYKTAKRYGQQIEEVPDELADVLKLYLRFHPLRKESQYPLLVNEIGEELHPVNGITRVLNKIFGKNVGSSMLRHIYLTDKYAGGERDGMKEDARKMAHSVRMQQDVYVKE